MVDVLFLLTVLGGLQRLQLDLLRVDPRVIVDLLAEELLAAQDAVALELGDPAAVQHAVEGVGAARAAAGAEILLAVDGAAVAGLAEEILPGDRADAPFVVVPDVGERPFAQVAAGEDLAARAVAAGVDRAVRRDVAEPAPAHAAADRIDHGDQEVEHLAGAEAELAVLDPLPLLLGQPELGRLLDVPELVLQLTIETAAPHRHEGDAAQADVVVDGEVDERLQIAHVLVGGGGHDAGVEPDAADIQHLAGDRV